MKGLICQDILWWDGGGWYSVNKKRADMILAVTNEYPKLLMNNRLGGDYPLDWSTPEQYIPTTGLDYDWETCMTCNDTWGYRSWDNNWKSTGTLIRNLVDIVSKGGNFLLNLGTKADRTIPEATIKRLKGIGKWMNVNAESIYGTTASPFENIAFGRCSKKNSDNGNTQLYIHVFNWPENGKLVVPRVDNKILSCFLLSNENRKLLKVSNLGDLMIIDVPSEAPDTICSVIRLDIEGEPAVMNPPKIEAKADILYDRMEVRFNTDVPEFNIRYTSNGKMPSEESPIYSENNPVVLTGSTTVKAALFRDGIRVSAIREQKFTKQAPSLAEQASNLTDGLKYEYFEGVWSGVPDFGNLIAKDEGIVYFCDVTVAPRKDHFGMRFSGYIKVPETGVYRFHADYNDGCNISIGEKDVLKSSSRVVDDAFKKQSTGIPVVLAKEFHPLKVDYFQRIDNSYLRLFWSGPSFTKEPVNAQVLYHKVN